jgi:hypothetical protein
MKALAEEKCVRIGMLLKVKIVYNYYNKIDVSRINTELATEEGAVDERTIYRRDC